MLPDQATTLMESTVIAIEPSIDPGIATAASTAPISMSSTSETIAGQPESRFTEIQPVFDSSTTRHSVCGDSRMSSLGAQAQDSTLRPPPSETSRSHTRLKTVANSTATQAARVSTTSQDYTSCLNPSKGQSKATSGPNPSYNHARFIVLNHAWRMRRQEQRKRPPDTSLLEEYGSTIRAEHEYGEDRNHSLAERQEHRLETFERLATVTKQDAFANNLTSILSESEYLPTCPPTVRAKSALHSLETIPAIALRVLTQSLRGRSTLRSALAREYTQWKDQPRTVRHLLGAQLVSTVNLLTQPFTPAGPLGSSQFTIRVSSKAAPITDTRVPSTNRSTRKTTARLPETPTVESALGSCEEPGSSTSGER